MRVAVISGYGGLDKIEYIFTATPNIKKNNVLVKVHSFALNPKDILVRKGKFKKFSGNQFPQKIGFEFSGSILQSKSKKYLVGDKVFGMFNGWHGQCSCEYISLSEDIIINQPSQLSSQQASGVTLAGLTALQALRDLAKLKPGMSVCINGASGGVGTLALQIAKSMSAHVTAITSHRNIALCKTLGADKIIDYTRENIVDSRHCYDVFFDVFGNLSFDRSRIILKNKGVYVTTVPTLDIFKQKFKNFFRSKKAYLVIVKSKTENLSFLAELIKTRKIKAVVDKVYPFDEIKQAQKYLESKRAKGKVIITFA